ncbi:MAG: SAM-dependent chlorinase/fluorinase [Nitrospirae bacterium]|nr:SAM-dependent chlorinase/fluorinase [Nitrospirota bacterium]
MRRARSRQIITLTTDFGDRDWFVASMKGVIHSIAPGCEIVDVSHQIAPGDVRAASFILAAAAPCFPQGTIHVGVVDPGVGSARQAIAIETGRGIYVGPNNGIFTHVMAAEGLEQAVRLDRPKYFRRPVSSTFHGRDVFAPLAAQLAHGVPLGRLGSVEGEILFLDQTTPIRADSGWRCRILYVDRFGNAITEISRGWLGSHRMRASDLEVRVGRRVVRGLARSYAEGSASELFAIFNSLDLLELSVRGGNAARRFGLRVGQEVLVRPRRGGAA